MQSTRVDVFFSCSFQDSDKELNEYFIAICSALDIKCINVDTAYSSVPPEKARDMISESQGVIVIGVARDKLDNGKFSMPQAVQEELSMAYGKKLPILSFIEDSVSVSGMKGNFGTYMSFSRNEIYSKELLEKIIKAIHTFKLEMLSPNELLYDHDISEALAEYSKQLVELKFDGSQFIWEYTISKKLCFLDDFKMHIPATFWATIPSNLPDDAECIKAEFNLIDKTRNLKLVTEQIKETPEYSKSLIKIEPNPRKNDFIEYSVHATSPYFNPLYSEDIKELSAIDINNKKYNCYDGFVPIQRTKKAVSEFRFPREYKLKAEDIIFFVGSYTDEVDYIIESEMKRAKVEIDDFGGNLSLRVEIESPLVGYMYGFAWNPPHSQD